MTSLDSRPTCIYLCIIELFMNWEWSTVLSDVWLVWIPDLHVHVSIYSVCIIEFTAGWYMYVDD